MKQRAPVIKGDGVQRQASAHAGAATAPDGPRLRQQGEQIAQLQQAAQVAQLQPTGAAAPVQFDPTRKTKGFSRGASHSKTAPNGKTSSHQPGKARTEKPGKSAAKNRKRDRLLAANVANSQAK